jgi:hypothetical protein
MLQVEGNESMAKALGGARDAVVILVLFKLTTSCYADNALEK